MTGKIGPPCNVPVNGINDLVIARIDERRAASDVRADGRADEGTSGKEQKN